MAKEENEEEVGKLVFKERKINRSGDAPRYYANNTEVAMSSFDLSIKFGLIEDATNEEINITTQATISMSLHHAKAVAKILTAYVKQFEQQHGPLFIPTPDQIEIPHETVGIKVDANS